MQLCQQKRRGVQGCHPDAAVGKTALAARQLGPSGCPGTAGSSASTAGEGWTGTACTTGVVPFAEGSHCVKHLCQSLGFSAICSSLKLGNAQAHQGASTASAQGMGILGTWSEPAGESLRAGSKRRAAAVLGVYGSTSLGHHSKSGSTKRMVIR